MSSDEANLIAQAAGGDPVAVQLLLVRHHAALVADIQRRLPAQLAGQFSADDICQETYVAAVRKMGDFQALEGGGFYPWLRTIAERKLTDAIRGVKAAKRGSGKRVTEPIGAEATSMVALLELLVVDERTPSQSMARREVVQHVQSALELLKTDYREALRLRYVKGMNVTEAAKQMGKTDGAMKMLCNRALKQLCEQLGDISRLTSGAVDVRPKTT